MIQSSKEEEECAHDMRLRCDTKILLLRDDMLRRVRQDDEVAMMRARDSEMRDAQYEARAQRKSDCCLSLFRPPRQRCCLRDDAL